MTEQGSPDETARAMRRWKRFAIAGVAFGCLGLALATVLVSVAFVAPSGASSGAPSTAGPSVDASLDWDAALNLTGTGIPRFIDTLSTDPSWVVATPAPDGSSDSDGTWTYGSADRQCALTFRQGALPTDVEVTENDDRRTTDAYLQSLDRTSADVVYQSALHDFLTFGENAGAFVSVRTLSGTDPDGNTYLTAARAFTQTGTGVSFDLRCAPQVDIDEYYYTVVAGVNVVLS